MIKKQKNIISYAFDCISRYKMRTIVILITFLIATTMISSVLFVKDGLEREAEISIEAAPDLTIQFLRGGRLEPIPTSYIDEISKIEGVEKVIPRIWGYVGISQYVFTIIGIDTSNISELENFGLESGNFIKEGDRGKEGMKPPLFTLPLSRLLPADPLDPLRCRIQLCRPVSES